MSERDKVAAIKFLITTLKASTKEHLTKNRKASKGYTFGQNTDVEQWLVADVIERKSPPSDNDEVIDDIVYDYYEDEVEPINIQLDDFAKTGSFSSQALVPVVEKRNANLTVTREERISNVLKHLLNEPNCRYERSVNKLFDFSRNFLKAVLNDFVFEHWIDGKLLLKHHRMLANVPAPSSATLTEIVDDCTEHEDSDRDLSLNDGDDEMVAPTLALENANDDNDPLKIKPKPTRKAKLYTCFQCPKV